MKNDPKSNLKYDVVSKKKSEKLPFKRRMYIFGQKPFIRNLEKYTKKIPLILSITGITTMTITTVYSVLIYCYCMYLSISYLVDSDVKEQLFLNDVNLTTLTIITMFNMLVWAFTTKVKQLQGPLWRKYIFFTAAIGIVFYFLSYTTKPIFFNIYPYLLDKFDKIEQTDFIIELLTKNTAQLMLIFFVLPSVIVLLLTLKMISIYQQYPNEISEEFKLFEYPSRFMQRIVRLNKDDLPEIILGPNTKTKESIIIPGKDRTLNMAIVGSIGTGKTATVILTIIKQDLDHMVRFINDFPTIVKREDYHTEDVKGKYLNGITVIEPSNDLCQKVYQLVNAHNIPKEAVYYINPLDPHTPNINPMEGPVEQVAETVAMVIDGLNEGGTGNFFFEQSQRAHLKNYIYLLKLHKPGEETTFDMLIDMYNDPQLVHHMHRMLKETFPPAETLRTMTDRDEINHWNILRGVDDWFNMNHIPQRDRAGNVMTFTADHTKYAGEDIYVDAKAEMVQGLRNILNDLAMNTYIRRVLFGKSKFSFDTHLEYGGILLVNTAKGDLGNLSDVLGKFILLSVQNATFRRTPDVSPYHNLSIDEFPDYLYPSFKAFTPQSRKYKLMVHAAAQTISQLSLKYGADYMRTLLTTMRNKIVLADTSPEDAEFFSSVFGENITFEETQSEQIVSVMHDNPVARTGMSYIKTKDAIMTPGDILGLKEFQSAVKIVKDNRSMPVELLDAHFVDRGEFKSATIQVEDDAGEKWFKAWEESTKNKNHSWGYVREGVPETITEDVAQSAAIPSTSNRVKKVTPTTQPNLEVKEIEADATMIDFSRPPTKLQKKVSATEMINFAPNNANTVFQNTF